MRRAIRLLLLLLVMGLHVPSAQAQLSRAWTDKESGKVYLLFGAGKIEVGDLNAALERGGYSVTSRAPLNNLADGAISFGLGSHGVVNGVLIGWELNGLVGREATNPAGTYKSAVTGGYGFLNLGYLTYSMDGLDIYPMLGIGGGGLRLKVAARRTLSFDQVLGDPDQSVELGTGGFLLNPALGLDYLLRLTDAEKRESGVVLGLRVGYVLTPLKGAWRMGEMDVAGGPQASVAGPYVRLMVGMGTRKSD